MQFDFPAVLVVFVFKLVAVLLLVLGGSEMFLPMPPSWPELLGNQYILLLSCFSTYFHMLP